MKKNTRSTAPSPRKLVLLVAAALALEPAAARAAALESLGSPAITFERNLGQFAPGVLFVTRGVRGEVSIREGAVSIAPSGRPEMRLALAGANTAPRVEALEPGRTRSNYYLGESARDAITGVPHFGRIVLKEVYPRVDLALHGAQGALEYDFLVAPGADPSAIRIDLSGAEAAWLDAQGNLRMRVAGGGELTQHAPVAYQLAGGERVAVAARFELHETESGLQAGFATGAYDAARELVIDPVLSYSTFMATGASYGGYMKADSDGNLHLAWADNDTAATKVTVRKFDPVAKEAIYTTQITIPGTRLRALAVADAGTGIRTYIAGGTTSPGTVCAPCTRPGGEDAFVMAFDATGAVVAGKTLGSAGADFAAGLAVDASANVYVTGTTAGTAFPSTVGLPFGGVTDAFVTKLTPDLATTTYSTFLGGSGADVANAIGIDAAGNAYVGGRSGAKNFPTDQGSNGGRDFVIKLDSAGAFVRSAAMLGASGSDISDVAVNAAGEVVVTGVAYGVTEAAFFARLNPATLSTLNTSTAARLLDGSGGNERGLGLTVTPNNVYVSGVTGSLATFPATSGAVQGAGGGQDAFVARYGPTGALETVSRFGGTGNDLARSVAVTPSGEVYVSGTTASSNFPLANATDATFAGVSDIFLAKFANEVSFTEPEFELWEDDANLAFRVSRTGSIAQAATVSWQSANGSALAGTHYGTLGNTAAPGGTITFAAGVGAVNFRVGTAASIQPAVRVLNDTVLEAPKDFRIALSNPSEGLALGGIPEKNVVVYANEDSVALLYADMTVKEQNGTTVARIPVVRQSHTGVPAFLDYATQNGTALAGQHYTARSGTLSWSSGDFEAKFIEVPIIGNTTANVQRNFKVLVSNPVGVPLAGQAFTTVTIDDDDDTIGMLAPTLAASEGAESVSVKVRRTGSGGSAASVGWSINDGTAKAGTDFGAEGVPGPITGTFTWAVGDTSEKAIVIPLLNDTNPEPVKNFTVTLSGVTGAKAGTATTTVTLTDNERGFAFASAAYSVNETQPSVTLSVNRIGATTGAATLTWATSNGTATAGQDFGVAGNSAQRTGSLSWAANDGAAKTLVIPILNDTIGGEGVENFFVTLTPGVGYVAGTPSVATVTLGGDDDIVPDSAVGFSQPKYVVLENVGNVTLEVRRVDIGGGFGRAATVKYATVAGTALATSDYTTRTGTLSWPAGTSDPKTIVVPIVNGTPAEAIESFKVVLSAPSAGLALGELPAATVAIIDDDEVFPLDGAMPAGFSIADGATRGWHVSSDPGAYEGAFALKSDEIDDGETAGLQMAGTFAAGNVSFRVKVSTEANFDKLRFYVDDVLQTPQWSGTAIAGWQASPGYAIPAGFHTLKWVYAKDGSASMGQDRVYIDGLVTPGFTPPPG